MAGCNLCTNGERDFGRDYVIAQAPPMREIDRRVHGADYGATSWTTRAQAELAAAQGLRRECRRVAGWGAGMAFSVISVAAPPADDESRRLLQQSGPPYLDAGADYAVLLHDTGWSVIERCDVTTEFARCMAVLLVETHARRDALRALLGEADFAERLQRRVSTQGALE